MHPTCLVSSRRFLAQNFYDRRILAFSSTSFVRKQSKHLPEHEYQVRLGAAIRVLRETLPTFMEQGLVDRMPSENSSSLLRVLKMGAPKRFSQPPDHLYHHNIHFAFQPAHATIPFGMISALAAPPSPDKQEGGKVWSPCFSFHGRNAYFLGASVLRHTLHACFSEALIHMEHMQFQRKAPPVMASPNSAQPGDELIMRIRFSGTNRFSTNLYNCFSLPLGQTNRHYMGTYCRQDDAITWGACTSKCIWARLSVSLAMCPCLSRHLKRCS